MDERDARHGRPRPGGEHGLLALELGAAVDAQRVGGIALARRGRGSPSNTRSVESATSRRPRSRHACATRPGRRAFTSSAASGSRRAEVGATQHGRVDDRLRARRVEQRARPTPRPRGRPRSPAGRRRAAGARWAAVTSSPLSWSSAARRPPSSPPAPVTRTRSGRVSADHHGAAVDRQDLAVQVAREVGGEERDRAGDLVRASPGRPSGMACRIVSPVGPVEDAARLMSGEHPAGRHALTRTPCGAELGGERFREAR